jgi:hypothetical protein
VSRPLGSTSAPGYALSARPVTAGPGPRAGPSRWGAQPNVPGAGTRTSSIDARSRFEPSVYWPVARGLPETLPRPAAYSTVSPPSATAADPRRCGTKRGRVKRRVGAALPSHGRSHRFDPCHAHQGKRIPPTLCGTSVSRSSVGWTAWPSRRWLPAGNETNAPSGACTGARLRVVIGDRGSSSLRERALLGLPPALDRPPSVHAGIQEIREHTDGYDGVVRKLELLLVSIPDLQKVVDEPI